MFTFLCVHDAAMPLLTYPRNSCHFLHQKIPSDQSGTIGLRQIETIVPVTQLITTGGAAGSASSSRAQNEALDLLAEVAEAVRLYSPFVPGGLQRTARRWFQRQTGGEVPRHAA
jgi:hypothetical protein